MDKYLSLDEQNKFTKQVNDFLHNLSKNDCVPLGPQYASLTSSDECEKNLALHRLKKKFCIPTGSSNLTELSVQKMRAHDHNVPYKFIEFVPACLEMDDDVRRLLYTTRNKLHEIFSNFRPGGNASVLPTGETDLPSRGDCSVYAKLRNVKQWRVTADCFDLAAGLIYNTPGLKSSARQHFLSYNKTENELLWLSFSNPFEVFKCKLLDFMTIVEGSRISTVPKNNDEERVINCEPFFNMVCQLNISQSIIKTLLKRYDYSKEHAQDIHRKMISDLSYSTIDLSKASDSNWLAVVNWLYPKRFTSYLNQARSPVGSFRGEQHVFNMLSPMGNGFTFEVMTTTLLALCRGLDPTSSVYGDDIVIRKEHSDLLLRALRVIGFIVNENKSFTDGLFRESCGAFFHDKRYLESFDFEYCQDVCDAVVAVNKLIQLRHILSSKSEIRSLLNKVPPILLMEDWTPKRNTSTHHHDASLDGCVRVPNDLMVVRRYKRKQVEWTRKIPKFKKTCRKDMSLLCYDHRQVDFVLQLRRETKNYIQLKKWKKPVLDNVRSRHLINAYLYAGMCTAPVVRNKHYVTGDLVVY